MTADPVPERRDTPVGVSRRMLAVLAALVVVPGTAYVVAVLLPYLTSDLDQLPLAHLADGTSDLSGQPSTTLVGFAAVVLAPLGALLALGGAVFHLLAASSSDARRRSPGTAAALGLVAVAGLAVLLWFLSPLGRALTAWQTD